MVEFWRILHFMHDAHNKKNRHFVTESMGSVDGQGSEGVTK